MSRRPETEMGMPERRRAARVSLDEGSWLSAPATWPIRLVDLSLGGLSFASPYAVEPGRTLTVRATLGPNAFSGHIAVRWCRPNRDPHAGRSGFEAGAAFLALDEDSRRALASFLKSPSAE